MHKVQARSWDAPAPRELAIGSLSPSSPLVQFQPSAHENITRCGSILSSAGVYPPRRLLSNRRLPMHRPIAEKKKHQPGGKNECRGVVNSFVTPGRGPSKRKAEKLVGIVVPKRALQLPRTPPASARGHAGTEGCKNPFSKSRGVGRQINAEALKEGERKKKTTHVFVFFYRLELGADGCSAAQKRKNSFDTPPPEQIARTMARGKISCSSKSIFLRGKNPAPSEGGRSERRKKTTRTSSALPDNNRISYSKQPGAKTDRRI